MGKRAQRIPSWPGVIHSNKGRIHLRRPTCDILTFRLRRSGGPYIPEVTAWGLKSKGQSFPQNTRHLLCYRVMRRREFLTLSAASIGGVLVYSLDREVFRLSAQTSKSV